MPLGVETTSQRVFEITVFGADPCLSAFKKSSSVIGGEASIHSHLPHD